MARSIWSYLTSHTKFLYHCHTVILTVIISNLPITIS